MEKENQQNLFEDPTEELESAIEKLKIFTHPEARGLEVSDTGDLMVARLKPLERVMNLARHYIVPLFSDQARQEKEKKLSLIKEEILKARDIIQSHSALIEKQKDKKFVHSALDAIKRYNAIVEKDYSSWTTQYNINNYERNQILLDEEICGQPIELPNVFSVQFDTHPEGHPAQKTLKELSHTFLLGPVEKGRTGSGNAIHKKSDQFMMDTFRMKAIRMIQSHITDQILIGNMLNLAKKTPIDIVDEGSSDVIHMRQVLEEVPGSQIILTGSFKKHATDSKFMPMPFFLDSFHLASQSAHAGYPYPSQHNGWALSEKFVEAFPLRGKQVPLFQQIDQKRKRLSQLLLFDQETMKKSRDFYLQKRDIFDSDRETFFKLHQDLQISLLKAAGKEVNLSILDSFYQFVSSVDSPYDFLARVQQKMVDLLVKDPVNKLEEQWLECAELRKGSHQDKLQHVIRILASERESAMANLRLNPVIEAYVRLMGPCFGESAQGITLQYFSEKIGFAPPMLNEFEQKMQACAFQQLMAFLDEFEGVVELTHEKMVLSYQQDQHIFDIETLDEVTEAVLQIVHELEVYFPARFYARYPRRSYIQQDI